MAFFDGDFFKLKFFKEPHFGEQFFQEPFFNDTTICHGQTAGTVADTTITIVGNRDIIGTINDSVTKFSVTVNGVNNIVTNAAQTLQNVTLTVTDIILAGEVILVSYPGDDANNFGILLKEPVVNNEV